MGKKIPADQSVTLPRDTAGRVLWLNVPGFREWFRREAPAWTNPEALAAIQARYGLAAPPIPSTVVSLRRMVGAPQLLATRHRAHTQKAMSWRESEDPVEALAAKLERNREVRTSANATFFELVGQKIIAAIGRLPAMPPIAAIRPAKTALDDEEMVLLISDVQAGLVVDARESGGLGNFNHAILLKELAYLQESILRIAQYHPNAKRLHVAFLGDIVEGEDIYGGQLREIDHTVIQQTLLCVEHFAQFLRVLSAKFPITCYGVVGNHGRIGRKGEHSPMSNFDYLIYRIMAERLSRFPRIRWIVPESWWQIAEILGWRFLLVHGDDVPSGSYGGIPFYGVARHKFRYRELFKVTSRMDADAVSDFDFLCIGHHSEAANFLNVLMNGSWPGGTEFSLKRLQLSAIPTQKLFGVHQRHGVTWVRDLHLRPLVQQ